MWRKYRVLFVLTTILCMCVLYFFVVIQPSTVIQNTVTSRVTANTLRESIPYWRGKIMELGPEKAYATFLKEASSDTISAHDQAHAFGEALYEEEGITGLQYCDSSFEFGCYHSFFGIAVYKEGVGVLPQFSEACKDKFKTMNLPCEHGIGHGVLVYADYTNLEKALELCETISKLPTGGCSSGVFMEYNFHTMDDSVGNTYQRDTKDDLYAPCNNLPERFQASCYFEQVQLWQNMFESDFKYIGSLCSQLQWGSDKYRACYNGIGNYVAAEFKNSYTGILSQCSLMPDEQSKGLCYEGASWLVRFDSNILYNPEILCAEVQDPFRTSCLEKLKF